MKEKGKLNAAVRCRLLVVLYAVSLTALSAQDTRSTEEIWEDTLRYGIDSSVISVIDEMQAAESLELVDELVEIFLGSRDAIQIRIIDFFLQEDVELLVAPIESEILYYQDLRPALTVKYLRYLKEFHPSGDEEVIEVIREIGEGTNPDLASAAIETLAAGQIVDDPEYFMRLFSRSGQTDQVRLAVLRALGNFTRGDVIDFIEEIAGDDTEETLYRQTAIEALGEIGDERSLPLFRRLINEDDPYIRMSVLQAYASVAGASATDAYRSGLRDSFWRIRQSVLVALADSPDPLLEDMVLYVARYDPETPVRVQAYRTAAAYGTESVWQALTSDVQSRDVAESYKILIVELLIRDRFEAARDIVESLIEQEWTKNDSRLLDAIARTLSTGSYPSAGAIFERLIGHSNITLRVYGIRGIGAAGVGEEYRALIEELAADEQPQAIRQNARSVLDRMNSADE